MSVKSYTRDCEKKVIGGIKTKLHLVCACDVDETQWPALKTTTGVGDKITYDGDIVLKAGKAFATVDIITDSGNLVHTGEGAETSKAFTNMVNFKLAKDIGADEWADQHLNGCFIAVLEQKDGNKRVIGEPGSHASIKSAVGTLAETISGESSWVFQLGDSTGKVSPYYEGVLDVTV
jgi:hypothetical protein